MIALPLSNLPTSSTPLAPGRLSDRTNASGAPSYAELAGIIHDRVLQSLGVALLQAELCRRLWDDGEPAEAMTELDGVVASIESAVDGLRGSMATLGRAGR